MNRLHGSLPEYLAEMPNLETLGLFMNNFTGVIPEKLGSNGKIELLDLSSNKLTGIVPDSLCSSNRLRVLILFNNFLFGAIPESLGKCLSLSKVRLGQNYLNGSIPSGLLYLPKLYLLELQNNYLTGPLSESTNNSDSSSLLAQLNLSNNQLSGAIPSSISILSYLQTMLLTDNRLEGAVPATIGQLHELVKLDLSRNLLTGSIPPEISNCSQLTYLDLSQNNLSGEIPPEISTIEILNYLNLSRNHLSQSIPKTIAGMKSLTSADFSFNDFSGRLPDTGQFSYFNASAFAGNPRLCGDILNNPCNFSAFSTTTGSTTTTTTSTATKHVPGDFKLVFALSLLVCSLIFAIAAIIKARAYKQGSNSSNKAGVWKLTTFQRVEFSISDVLDCMKDCNVIGRGGAGVVYIGRTPTGHEFAAKRLLGFNTSGHDHGFRAEVKTMANIRHRNIVRLLGFCSNSEMNVLVYEYMRNGSLGEVLHGKGGGFLGWDRRYRIAIEAGRGLCYLHHDCKPMIVHRDVKSNNILLDSEFEAHVADFGLAKLFLQDTGVSECMSAIAGSYGYIAPEYAYTLKVDEKSDVYSYGVVLLELITGRRPVGGFGDGVDIVQWAKRTTACNKDNVARIVDSRLSTLPIDEAMHVFFVAMLCVQENSVERPTMREVVQMLTEIHRHATLEQSPSSSSSSDHQKIDSHCYKLFPDLLT
ncbi:Non-specific serine/threonine protein kinase protein [Dioscorea alata]|uniref:Non-specific serine/threonine protein kinase protein n=1 Tax=Dioscorea alata TaxID=55571 RepID=A0ACB7VAT8_DIOAL|nr:Non-specific serine/threonine protein kinase protein [Dioscorea alata]